VQRGDLVPEFELPDEDGKPTTLGELVADGPLVLFFYPMAMTAGCTKESCHFRDLAEDFKQVGARRVGISTDPVEKQRRFADLHDFGYRLLSDVDGTVARIFGVKRRIGLLPVKRTTFVIGTDRRVIDVISSELHMNKHADEALAVLRRRNT
jgi:thioredoxin-dependent peroxiredoxin